MSGEEEACIRYFGVLKSVGDTYGFIKCRRTHLLYNRDVYITKADLAEGWEISKPVSFQVVLNERGRPQARDVKSEETLPEETDEEQPEALQKAHSAPLPSTRSASKSPPASSPPRSLELKPLSAPTAPWADIVDDDEFEPLDAPVQVQSQPLIKAPVEEDDGLGEWGRRRRSMSAPDSKPQPSNATPQEEERSDGSDQPRSPTAADGGHNEEESGLLQRLLGAEDEKNTQVRTPAVGLPLGAPPSATGKRWGASSSGDESEALLQDVTDMGALSPGSDAIWRTQDPFYQQVMLENAAPAPAPMPCTAVCPTGPPMVEQGMQEGQTWPWQGYSWTQYQQEGSTWQFSPVHPTGSCCGAMNDQSSPHWPQDMWQGETTQWTTPGSHPTETWQREPGQEILKQLGVTRAADQAPVQEENLFLPEALWNRTDVVRALCFKRSRRFLLGAESDLLRLLKAPEGALLRIPKLAPLYQRLLRELCKRFRTREESTPTGDFIIRTTSASFAPLLPLAAFVPRTWGGSNPNAWEDRRRDPASLRGKHNMTPCPGLLVPPLHGLYDEFGPGADGDDLGNLGGFGASHRWDMRESEQAQWAMQLLPKQWRFIEPQSAHVNAQDDGMVVTVSLDLSQCGEGFGLALCEQGGAFQEPLCRLLDGIHGETRQIQRSVRSANFHVLLVQPSQSGPSPTGEPRWCLKLGHGEQAVQGEYVDCRTVSWQDEGRMATTSGTRSATFWLATYAGGSMGAIQGLDDGGMLVEAGVGRFPWGRIFRARVQRCGVLRKVAVGALGRMQGTHLSAVSLESSICPDLASREHVVKLSKNAKKSSAAGNSPWWLQPGKHGLVALFDGLAICESAEAALRLQRTAEECSNGAWQAKTLATASIEEVGGQHGNCGLQREQRAKCLMSMGRPSAVDLALDEWAAVAEASKKALLPDPPLMAPPPPPVPPPPPASQQPQWPTPTPPPPPPVVGSRLSADAPVFTPSFVEEAKPALSCNAQPFIPGNAASNMNASAEEFMPQVLPEQTWGEEWPETWKEEPTWNDSRRWSEREIPMRDEKGFSEKGFTEKGFAEKGFAEKGFAEKGFAKGKGKKGTPQWAVGGHHWKGGKGPEPRDGHRPDGRDGRHHASVVEREGPVRGARGAPARHHGSHAERVEREWNDWEEAKWDEWDHEWSEAWRSQWRGAESEPKPSKWNQERRNSNRAQHQKQARPQLRQRKYSDSTEEVISSSSSNSKDEETVKGRGKGFDDAPAPRAKLRRMWQEQREAERAARTRKNARVPDEASPKAAVDVDKSALLRHLRVR